MKKNLSRILLGLPVLAVCLLLGLLFGQILFVYTVPMRDVSYDLSLFGNEVAIPDDFRYRVVSESRWINRQTGVAK